MRKYIVLFLFICLNVSLIAQESKTKIHITSFAECDSSELSNVKSKLAFLQEKMAIKLQEVYSCADITTQYEVHQALKTFREQQILGVNNDTAVQQLANSLVSKYLISFTLKVAGNTAIISALCMDYKKANAIARAMVTAPYSSLGMQHYDKIAEDLIKGLKTTEICPFKGEIKIKIVGEFKDVQNEEYPVSCNGFDFQYKKKVTTNNYSENDWSFAKKGINSTSGNIKFNISEEFEIDEYSPCFDCTPTKQASRSYYEKITTYSIIDGLSKESETKGVKVDDARTEITFLEDGTYTLRIKAASRKGEKKTVKEVRASGACQIINDAPKRTVNKIDAGLNELFGPFQGNGQDRSLSHSETITRINPINQQKETITIEFNLSRN